MKSKGRYGQFVRWIFSIVDLLIANLAFFIVMKWKLSDVAASEEMFSRPVWLVLNVAVVVCIYLYNDVHDRRVFYADKVVGQALKFVITHAGIFIALTSLLGPFDAPWQYVLLFYLI